MDKHSLLTSLCKPKVKPVDIDGQTLHLRVMSGGELLQLKKLEEKHKDNGLLILLFTVSDEQGNRLFSDEDIQDISKLPFNVASYLVNESLLHNGMIDDIQKKD